jgi:hypothetical protein
MVEGDIFSKDNDDVLDRVAVRFAESEAASLGPWLYPKGTY